MRRRDGEGVLEANGTEVALSLRELLAVPYRIEAFTTEGADGWVRHASYPELPGCSAEAQTIEEALRALERRRVEIIAAEVAAGRTPPVPRPPLCGVDPTVLAAELGLSHLLPPES